MIDLQEMTEICLDILSGDPAQWIWIMAMTIIIVIPVVDPMTIATNMTILNDDPTLPINSVMRTGMVTETSPVTNKM